MVQSSYLITTNQSPPSSSVQDMPDVATASSSGRSVAAPFSLLNATTEAINGRAAMLGFVSAVAAEALTHHTVFSQVGAVWGLWWDGLLKVASLSQCLHNGLANLLEYRMLVVLTTAPHLWHV